MASMGMGEQLWLVHNNASGSNDEAALAELEEAVAEAGFVIARRTTFPDQPAPDAATLDAEEIPVVCVFAGDGTIHTVVTGLFGWQGRIIVLPGGTMNLLAGRLHGEATPARALERIAAGICRIARPPIMEGRHGYALTGILAGPGTTWNDVREAMRAGAVGEIASAAASAVSDSVRGARVTCRGLSSSRAEGYAAVSAEPTAAGIIVSGYYADGAVDYLGQVAALMRGDFRDGPHDKFGPFPQIEIESMEGLPMGLLMDGEPYDGDPRENFRLTSCNVDLVATLDA
jgi:hypothetical protein